MVSRVMEMELSGCLSCGHEVAQGGGYGDDFAFSYVYCLECDTFLNWDSFGVAPDANEATQHWIRERLLDTYKHQP